MIPQCLYLKTLAVTFLLLIIFLIITTTYYLC